MKTLTIGEFKSHLSDILDLVRKGEEIVISFGKKREKVAVIVPYDHYRPKSERKLGLLKGKGNCTIRDDFAINDEEFLKL